MVCPSETSVLNPDRQLEDRLRKAFEKHDYWPLRNVQVSARSGRITLAGQVPTFYARQVCHQACRQVPGVEQIVDNVTVREW